MDAKKLLVGVATAALGWMFGLWAVKNLMGSKTTPTPVTTTEPPATTTESFADGDY